MSESITGISSGIKAGSKSVGRSISQSINQSINQLSMLSFVLAGASECRTRSEKTG
jgi:hypothetical protein